MPALISIKPVAGGTYRLLDGAFTKVPLAGFAFSNFVY
jgi:hypothetical protein